MQTYKRSTLTITCWIAIKTWAHIHNNSLIPFKHAFTLVHSKCILNYRHAHIHTHIYSYVTLTCSLDIHIYTFTHIHSQMLAQAKTHWNLTLFLYTCKTVKYLWASWVREIGIVARVNGSVSEKCVWVCLWLCWMHLWWVWWELD